MNKYRRYRFLQLILALVFCVSAGLLAYQMVYLPMKNREAVVRLKEEFPEDGSPPGDASSQKDPSLAGKEDGIPVVDLTAIQREYPDVQGWLTIPGTNVDYPVLQSGKSNPEYYLKRNYKGERDVNGSLFLQWNCQVSESRNLVIYGHNMNSGAMFGSLDDYADEGYCKEHAAIYFQTLEGVAEYEVVSVMKADVRMFPFQQVEFQDTEGVQEYLRQAKAIGLFEVQENNIAAESTDQVLTLVTCSYEWKDARNIIVAVRKGGVGYRDEP